VSSIRNVKDSYDEKYRTETFRNADFYFRLALKVLSPQTGENLLDVGCALGHFMEAASQEGINCYGLDLSPMAVKQARQRVPSATVAVGNAETLGFGDETFDNVTLLSTLEHLLHPAKGLLEVQRVLKWGGKALIVVPNSYYLPDIIWEVALHGYGPNHKQVVQRFGTAHQWRLFIASGGLRVLRTERYNFMLPRTRRDWEWYRINPRRWLGLLAAPFIPFHLSNSFLYLCEKHPASRGERFDPPAWPAPPNLDDRPNYAPN
jgi:ubiquinone/menaquinone biosynthesis C-methylase UbiE